MFTDVFRIVVERLLFRSLNEKRKVLVEEKRHVDTKISYDSSGRLDIEKWMRENPMFETQPLMALEYSAIASVSCPIFRGLAIIVTIFMLVAGLWITICEGEKFEINELLVMGVCLGVFYLLAGGLRYLQLYMENTKTVYYGDRICVKRYRKTDREISYQELKAAIEERKILVRKGRLEFPYQYGRFYEYAYGEETITKGFCKFMNKRCGINIPMIDKKECEIIRKAGMGSGFAFVLGAAVIIVGVMLNLIHIWPAKKLFRNSTDIIKVKLF